MPIYTSLVTLLIVAYYIATGMIVARTHSLTGIAAPRMEGDPRLERAIRVQMNAVEFAPILFPALFLAAFWFSDKAAAFGGLVWLLARIAYAIIYMKNPERRALAFTTQATAALALMLMAGWGIISSMLHS